MSIPEPDSNSLLLASQCPGFQTRLLLAACRLLLIAACTGLTGCTSIYHRALAKFPSQPCDELKMRVQEAQGGERLARQAGVKLRADLEQGMSGEIIQADFDRLEMLALELQRRVLAARDATAQTETAAPLAAEFERLQRRSASWLNYVQTSRHADVATQTEKLDGELLDIDEGSAGSNR
jgi:hypothetical protein